MLSGVSRYAGVIFALIWLATSALAAPIVDSDDVATPTVASDAPSSIDVAVSPSAPQSAVTDIPQASKPVSVEDILHAFGVAPDPDVSSLAIPQTFVAPLVENSGATTPAIVTHSLAIRVKPQDVPPASAAVQPVSNFVAQQNSSPLIIATPEPSSIGLLLIGATTLLARRRTPRLAQS